jgi:uncharacterized protein YeaO (DUF488 family)
LFVLAISTWAFTVCFAAWMMFVARSLPPERRDFAMGTFGAGTVGAALNMRSDRSRHLTTGAMMGHKVSKERVRIKRAYEAPSAGDGTRVLIDRLWPRGISKAEAAVDHWMKEIAPSTELRKWFGHDPARWEEFRRRYRSELKDHGDDLDRLRELAREGVVTLIYGARDEAHNDAVVVRDLLMR